MDLFTGSLLGVNPIHSLFMALLMPKKCGVNFKMKNLHQSLLVRELLLEQYFIISLIQMQEVQYMKLAIVLLFQAKVNQQFNSHMKIHSHFLVQPPNHKPKISLLEFIKVTHLKILVEQLRPIILDLTSLDFQIILNHQRLIIKLLTPQMEIQQLFILNVHIKIKRQ